MRATGFAGVVLAIVVTMPPMSAVASTVERQGTDDPTISYTADSGESNLLSISRGAENFSFRENSGVEVSPNGGCVPPAMRDPSLAWCPALGVERVTVLLGDYERPPNRH